MTASLSKRINTTAKTARERSIEFEKVRLVDIVHLAPVKKKALFDSEDEDLKKKKGGKKNDKSPSKEYGSLFDDLEPFRAPVKTVNDKQPEKAMEKKNEESEEEDSSFSLFDEITPIESKQKERKIEEKRYKAIHETENNNQEFETHKKSNLEAEEATYKKEMQKAQFEEEAKAKLKEKVEHSKEKSDSMMKELKKRKNEVR